MNLYLDRVSSPIGTLVIVANDTALCAVEFDDNRPASNRVDPLGASSRMRAYLQGDLQALDDVPVDPSGTPFQRRVWTELRRIPAGTTISYRQLATNLGNPNATRAVGLANGRNPIAIVIPCHRVIGATGSLTGYGGGLDRKRWLLEHEGCCLRLSAP